MVPGEWPLIAIGYKYNAWEFLYFITTEDIGITDTGITYLYNYPGTYSNVSIRNVAHNIFISKLLLSVNEVDSNKKYRQPGLDTEK